ncbi:hypothetical protein DFR76_104570 [Nocardia pseudobrasiliensis]|uniref:Uncharacterized protein n=1 Tax=Nocardia pseudobrasiliensis TaxID=45979 RepID=A0A370I7W0_9NOCA|nr:hypothetical protein DFR76_104570 [Nocardia pseudobrasiliensis]
MSVCWLSLPAPTGIDGVESRPLGRGLDSSPPFQRTGRRRVPLFRRRRRGSSRTPGWNSIWRRRSSDPGGAGDPHVHGRNRIRRGMTTSSPDTPDARSSQREFHHGMRHRLGRPFGPGADSLGPVAELLRAERRILCRRPAGTLCVGHIGPAVRAQRELQPAPIYRLMRHHHVRHAPSVRCTIVLARSPPALLPLEVAWGCPAIFDRRRASALVHVNFRRSEGRPLMFRISRRLSHTSGKRSADTCRVIGVGAVREDEVAIILRAKIHVSR